MAKENGNYLQNLINSGVCDQRGATVCATATGLPDGSFGMCLLGVNGNILNIYDTNMKGEAGKHLYSIPLREAADMKISNGFFGELLKGYSFRFSYKNFVYTFKNCAMKKQVMAVIAEEAAK